MSEPDMQENLGHEPPNLPLLYLGAGHFQRLGKGAGLVTVKDMMPAEFVDPFGDKDKGIKNKADINNSGKDDRSEHIKQLRSIYLAFASFLFAMAAVTLG